MGKFQFAVIAFVVGSVLGFAFGSTVGHQAVPSAAIGGAAGLAVAWLILFREANA